MDATTTLIAKNVLRDTGRHRVAARAAPISWRRALRYALLCSVAMAVLQSFTLPVGELSWREMLPFTTSLLGVHVVSTIAMAWLAIVQSYVQLWAELNPQRAGWRIHIDAQPQPAAGTPLIDLNSTART